MYLPASPLKTEPFPAAEGGNLLHGETDGSVGDLNVVPATTVVVVVSITSPLETSPELSDIPESLVVTLNTSDPVDGSVTTSPKPEVESRKEADDAELEDSSSSPKPGELAGRVTTSKGRESLLEASGSEELSPLPGETVTVVELEGNGCWGSSATGGEAVVGAGGLVG